MLPLSVLATHLRRDAGGGYRISKESDHLTEPPMIPPRFTLTAALLGPLCGRACCPGEPVNPVAIEHINPNISPDRFRTVGTVSGGAKRTDKRIAASVRQQMQDSGIAAVRSTGSWATEMEALRYLCAAKGGAPVDGVLFIWYNRLSLLDCASELRAYEIGGEGAGIGVMA